MMFNVLKKRGIIYIPFLMVMILIFTFAINSNYITKDMDVYLNYEKICELNDISEVNDFISQLKVYKDNYYNKIDLGIIDSDLSFLNYVKKLI